MSRSSAFWQLYRATQSTGLGLAFEYFPAFSSSLVQRIGPDENVGSVGWQFRVNHVALPGRRRRDDRSPRAPRCSGTTAAPTRVRELDVTPSSDKVSKGTAFTVAVTSYSDTGEAAPGAGATVRYGQSSATADAAGAVTFIAQGNGTQPVSATRAGDIRSAGRNVCSFDGDPTVCNLPPPRRRRRSPPTRTPIPPGQPHHGPPHRRPLHAASGRSAAPAGADRSDVEERRGRPRAAGRHAVPLPHQDRQPHRAALLHAAPVPAGRARRAATGAFASASGRWSRAPGASGAAPPTAPGNVESVALARVNGGQFTIARATPGAT